MTDTAGLDRAIVEAVARYFDARPDSPQCRQGWLEIQLAHQAKREAEAPKLLTAEEALSLYWGVTCERKRDEVGVQTMANVLAAVHGRAALVVDRDLGRVFSNGDAQPCLIRAIVRRALTGKE